MSRSSRSRSGRIGDNADVTYDIEMPFESKNASIYLFDRDNETVEVLIGRIPEPKSYHNNYNSSDEDFLRQHGIARWIVEDAAEELEAWDYKTSSYKTNNPNYHLRDVYFECDIAELDDAVLAAKQFLSTLEEKVIKQRERVDKDHATSPQRDLNSAINN